MYYILDTKILKNTFFMTMKNQLPFLRLGTALLYFFLLAVLSTPAWGVRVKDIAALRGARDNELIG
ncbi:hypothetical protein OAJ16_00770, partial [Deltaproteobacteria bacterium]|nr:hypothetical protein [Deltaproteobacteria bacterium]